MRRCVYVLAGMAGIPAWLLVGIAAAPAASPSHVRIGSPPAHPSRSKVIGALRSATRIALTVTLKPRDPAALASYAAAVATPGSSLYHHYLTVAGFRRRFGPTRGQIDAVAASLSAQGLRPGPVSANGLAIPVSASAGAIAHAFALSFQRVALASGRTAFANTQAPQFATSSASIVQGVIGLDNLSLPHPQGIRVAHAQARPAAAATGARPQVVTSGPQPCPTAVNAGPDQRAYTADQIASAYQFSNLYGNGDEGAGQTIAVYELEPNSTSDIAAYQSCYGTSTSVDYVPVDGGAGSGPGSGEAALDIEDVIGLAPKATVLVYQGPNNGTGVYDTYNQIISDNLANVISTSWGLCEAEQGATEMEAENTLFQEASTQGQSIFAASGDEGSEACHTSSNGDTSLAVSDPASQPFVTGVGGTTLSTLGPPPTESAWNDRLTDPATDLGAGGGGISIQWQMPSYQSGAPPSLNVINSRSSRVPCGAPSGSFCREVPDVSADADPDTGYLINYQGNWVGIGGTSAAAPTWAAFMALVNASDTCNGAPIGFANPVLYDAAANGYSSDFNDITSGNNDYTNSHAGRFAAGTGYDMASGLGTPNGSTLAPVLCNGGTSPTKNTITVTNPGSQTSTIGTDVSLQLTSDDPSATYKAQRLPPGLVMSSSGLITGTPTRAGNWTVTVTATDQGPPAAAGRTGFRWTITRRSTATSVSCSPKNLAPGAATTCTATVSDTDTGTASAPTGTVSFVAPGQGSFTNSGMCDLTPVLSSSTASCPVTYSPGSFGAPQITASYVDDGTHLPSTSDSFTLIVPAPPSALISSPANNQTFALGHPVRTSFGCGEGLAGPGLTSCRDSNGTNGPVSGGPGSGTLNTASVGAHTYTVTATSGDRLTGRATISYTVVGAPTNTGAVRISGTPKAGAVLVCSTGSWTGSPTRFTYQWRRDGTPIVGANSARYRVQAIDEGNTLTCTVTASNVAGVGAPATSANVTVPVPHVAGCPRATGRLSGTTLGLLKLGTTRKQAKHAYKHSSDRGTRYQDFFCLTPIGIRAGYPSPKLLASLPARQRGGLRGRVIWISTASAFYAVDGIRPGATVAAASGSLKLGKVFRIGANDWYLAPAGRATAVLKVRGGIVQEIGIANQRLTKTRSSQRMFLTSFS
jgi:Pro-kumamolisin, activation domain/Putative Ig domain/Bacterial Ig-like domain (group 3)